MECLLYISYLWICSGISSTNCVEVVIFCIFCNAYYLYIFCIFCTYAAFPAITSLDNSQTVELGQTTTFTCENTGIPTPNVVWFKNGTVIQNNADYIISGNQLTISNVQPNDLTSFQCLVSNEVGTVIKELFLCGQSEYL